MQNLVEIIAAEVRAQGAIPFSRFMELALYCPVYGYYEREKDNIGRGGDFYTSVSVGPLFGEMLAWQFAEWFAEILKPASSDLSHMSDSSDSWQLVEAGAHRGELAQDILSWLREHRPRLMEVLEYSIVEPSEPRRQWQQQTLSGFEDKVRWMTELAAVGHSGRLRGIIFSNELLDAMPVHRLGWDAARRRWFEWGVALQNGRFAWVRMPFLQSTVQFPGYGFSMLADASAVLSDVLPDGFTTEVCPAAEDWWGQAARMLNWGKLLTLDYGLTEAEMLMPERVNGSLRAYRRHRLSGDVLAAPGQQDLTANVNFSAIQKIGESAGLETETLVTQEQFLTSLAAKLWSSDTGFGPWTPERTRQFQTLVHPQHLGRAFRVLVQRRIS